jgi:ethanolamine utilization protein EutN
VRSRKFSGERLLLALPWTRETFAGDQRYAPGIVVYDDLGANVGQVIGISEGREAACPFPQPTPVDAYCAALVDQIHFEEQEQNK